LLSAFIRRTIIALAVLTLVNGAAFDLAGQATGTLEQRLQASLDSLHAAGSFPGGTVGVTLPDGRVIGLAVGQSDTVANTAMKPDDMMLAGSVGKTFFAAVAYQLIAEGTIGLDDPISKYLGAEPWFSRLPNASDITIRMLMNHTSGLVRYEFDDAFTRAVKADPYRVWEPEEQVAYLLDKEPPFAAGQGWDYSDTNYIVLAMIMERVTGDEMYAMIERRVTAPLGLTHVMPQTGPVLPGLVQGYAGPSNPFSDKDAVIENGRLVFNPQFEWAGGGFVANAQSLSRWAWLLYRNQVFDASLNDDVFAGIEARGLGRGVHYGLGVIISETPLGTSYGHSGFFPGYLSEMRYWPDHGFSMAIQINTSAGRPLPRGTGGALVALAGIVSQTLGGGL
jgi:D-alanyl-D-alanine carboxypeptidase